MTHMRWESAARLPGNRIRRVRWPSRGRPPLRWVVTTDGADLLGGLKRLESGVRQRLLYRSCES